jgi:hypothetical protein
VTVTGVSPSKKAFWGVTVISPVPGLSCCGSCEASTILSLTGDFALWP